MTKNTGTRREARPEGLSSFADRFRAQRSSMPDAAVRVGELIEHDPTVLIGRTIKELSLLAQVSSATVTRFSRFLGYSSLSEMRVAVATELGRSDSAESWRDDVGRDYDPADSREVLLEKLMHAHVRIVKNTAANLDLNTLSRVAAKIVTASRVDFYAVEGSAKVAEGLANRLFRIGIQARAWSDPHMGIVSAVNLGEQGVAIGMSQSGSTAETVAMLRQAADSGAYTVALVGDRTSKLASIAEDCLRTSPPDEFQAPDDLTPRYGQGLVTDMLFLLVARADVENVGRRLSTTRTAVDRYRGNARKGVGAGTSEQPNSPR